MRTRDLMLALFVAMASTVALAGPVITSVGPTTVPVTGGIQILIRGTGFSNNCPICSPPFAPPAVTFGGTPAAEVRYFTSTLIGVVTPPLLPGKFPITLTQWDGGTTLQDAVDVTGEPEDAFERILFPIFTPPVFGSFGSEFRTLAHGWNSSTQTVNMYGMDTTCLLITPVLDPRTSPWPFGARGSVDQLLVECSRWPARVMYVPKGSGDALSMNLRVADVSRAATTLGTEIPVVREAEMTTGPVALIEVPVDPLFRSTLRIYSLARDPVTVDVTIDGVTQAVVLTPGADIFEPAYAVVTDFPTSLEDGRKSILVVVEHAAPVTESTPPIWAFVSVTNNETQHITTITPN